MVADTIYLYWSSYKVHYLFGLRARGPVQNSQHNRQPPPATNQTQSRRSLAFTTLQPGAARSCSRLGLCYASPRTAQITDFAAIGIALSYRTPKTVTKPPVFSIWFDS